MYTTIAIIIVVASVLLTIVVLIQNSKGGGLAANFAAGNQVFGTRQTADILEKATWTLAVVIIVLCVLATAFVSTRKAESSTLQDRIIESATAPAQPQFPINAAPEQAPAQEVPAEAAAEQTPEAE